MKLIVVTLLLTVYPLFFQNGEILYENYKVGTEIKKDAQKALHKIIRKDYQNKQKIAFVINIVSFDTLSKTYSFSIGYIYDGHGLERCSPKNYFLVNGKIILVKSNVYSSDEIESQLGFLKLSDEANKILESQIRMDAWICAEMEYRYIITKTAEKKEFQFFADESLMPEKYSIYKKSNRNLNFIIKKYDIKDIDTFYRDRPDTLKK